MENEDRSLKEATKYWLRLGCTSFGGPAAQIAMMHEELVVKRRWISENQFLHGLNFCMMLPGPEAHQLSIYLGWRLHGWRGGLVAGTLFVLPAALMMFGLSALVMLGGETEWVIALLYGLSAAVIALVFQAMMKIGKTALRSPLLWLIAAASFAAIYFAGVSFILIVAAAGLIGAVAQRLLPKQFPEGKSAHGEPSGSDHESAVPVQVKPTWARALRVLAVGLAVWWVPLILLGMAIGWKSTPFLQGLFFSKASMVTFGGAYAVLPYVAQQAVVHFEWLSKGQMMQGLALAETTPGPLIIVMQFVGFVGAWQHPGDLSPWVAASLGSAITVWCMFVPSFLMIFLAAPYIELLRKVPVISGALVALTAAVVGVMLNLALLFAHHALWPVAGGPIDGFMFALTAMALIAMRFLKWGLMPVMGCCVVAGMLWKFL